MGRTGAGVVTRKDVGNGNGSSNKDYNRDKGSNENKDEDCDNDDNDNDNNDEDQAGIRDRQHRLIGRILVPLGGNRCWGSSASTALAIQEGGSDKLPSESRMHSPTTTTTPARQQQ